MPHPHIHPEAPSALAPQASQRVSVLVHGRSVPLISDPPIAGSNRSPWTGILVEKHHLRAVEIPEHEHSTFCLHLQSSGPVSMDWHSSGNSGHVRSGPGSMIFLAPGTHDSMLWHGPSDRIVVSLEPTLLHQASEQLELKGPIDFENRWSFQNEQLALLLTEMEREMRSGWAMGSLYGDLLGLSLSIALLKNYGSASPFPFVLKGGLARPSLRRVLSYIEANLGRDLRLSELAAIAKLSIFHFARSFRESTGSTPHQYITERRIETARALLRNPEWSIQQIASAIGFTDASQFAKLFKRNTGQSPTAWRNHF